MVSRKGEGGSYVSDGTIELGAKRPNNLGPFMRGYTHGMNMVIETHATCGDVDDTCPTGRWQRKHLAMTTAKVLQVHKMWKSQRT